ncbi:hypothetical protein D1818_15150 [Aquimarina sp. BL5]|uniref:hypothetical protein n=1 Tax=Aquimarina sp. BL5 TaxID=1714860 RepID=UPI000E4DFB09|nr:hypothetical protein [Aquimarina sp. BL5]AXT52111.1 hypothetical protein D1818_15150 [Aquimarina sp. BL5]RKN10767.1 hypothetical protein D7036_01815 [Aquimarina sp. BL5]
MGKTIKLLKILVIATLMGSCASGYKTIVPAQINYKSSSVDQSVVLNYEYNLLNKRYSKKEIKKGVKLIAVKITNNGDRDLVFDKDILLQNQSGTPLTILESKQVFKKLKQSVPSYLWYLLLAPLNLQTTKTNEFGQTTSNNVFPVGLIVGPGIAGGNMIVAGSANKKFKMDLYMYNLQGTRIKKGSTVYGLVGIKSNTFKAIDIKLIK